MNTALYRKRRLRSNAHILTVDQIRDLGKLAGLTSIRPAIDHFTSPSTLFRWSKSTLVKIHRYLLENGITREKLPSRHVRQGDHACLLLQIMYPGYPVAKAKEQAYKYERECRKHGQRTELAYDLLPTSDIFERVEELTQLRADWYHQQICETSITLKNLEPFTRKRRTLSSEQAHHLRLHIYLWKSSQLCHPLQCLSLRLNGHETWTDKDKDISRHGYRYIDITDKINWQSDSSDTLALTFTFDDGESVHVRYLSICTVRQKTAQELVSQLYIQSSAACVSDAIQASKDAKQTQRDFIDMLEQCPIKDRANIEKTETVYNACATAFSGTFCDSEKDYEDNREEDLVVGDESVSVADPIMLGRIRHPARSVFCQHTACFDALYFFKCYYNQRLWQCPVCFVQIKGLQELYIDHPMMKALLSYPDENYLVVRNGSYVPASFVCGVSQRTPLAPIELLPCENQGSNLTLEYTCDVIELT